ncbi:MAG TPA: DUF4835 family protein [Ignavibacteriales bacterium]|nr:DUF4835 family protein [Ignavibacteriales bacterium]
MKYLLLLLLLPACLFAQELDAIVKVNTEKLPTINKDLLSSFAQEIQDYLNNNRFTGDAWEGDRIKCSFNIFFDNATDETHYSAQVSVTSLRPIYKSNKSSLMLNVLDNQWNFVYERGQSMYFNQSVFDPLTSFLNFYAYLIIGLDADSYNMLGGSQLFSQAYNIALLGANSKQPAGWEKSTSPYNRRGLIEDLLNEKYRTFREDYFNYHYNGLDIYNLSPQDKQKAQENIAKLIRDLDVLRQKQDIRGILMKVFFDTKSAEIVNYMKDYPDKTIFATLKRIDPAHISKYDEALEQQ